MKTSDELKNISNELAKNLSDIREGADKIESLARKGLEDMEKYNEQTVEKEDVSPALSLYLVAIVFIAVVCIVGYALGISWRGCRYAD